MTFACLKCSMQSVDSRVYSVDLFGQLEPVLCYLRLGYAVQTCLLLTVIRLEDWNLVPFCIDGEIAKKAEKERLQKDRPTTQSGKKKRTWEEDMADETEVDETEEDFLRFYFVRERVITERIFGGE